MSSRKVNRSMKLKSADALQLSPDGQYLAGTRIGGKVILYDLLAQSEILASKPLKNIVTVNFSPCSRYLALINDTRHWCVLAVPSGEVLAQGQAPATQSGSAPLFLPDSSGLFVTSRQFHLLDATARPPQWQQTYQATLWHWPDGIVQGERELSLPLVGDIYPDYPRGRYLLAYPVGVALDPATHVASFALCHWSSNLLTADFTDIPPPPQAAMPAHFPGTGRWKNINTFSVAADGDIAILLRPGHQTTQSHDLVLLDGQHFQPQAFSIVAEAPQLEARNCALGAQVVAVSCCGEYHSEHGHSDAHIAFFSRDGLQPLGRLKLPSGQAANTIVFHPSGTGFGIAMGAQSRWHFDCPQQPEALLAWLAAQP